MAEDHIAIWRARTADRNSESTVRTTVKTSRHVTFADNAAISSADRRENESFRPTSILSRGAISQTDYRDDADLWNRASQTEGISSTEGYVKILDVLHGVQEARKNFLDCSAVKFLRHYSRDTDEKAKTGYTYASGLSYKLNGDPNTPVPNMSRYSLDHYARCTENGYDYSRSETSSDLSRSSTSLVRGLDFSDSSGSSFVTTPEPSSSIRDYLTRIFRTVVTTTTTHTFRAQNDRENDLSNGSSSSRGRITPESRSGNDLADRHDRSSLLSSSDAKISSATTDYSKYNGANGFQSTDTTRTYTPASASYYGMETRNRSRISKYSPAAVPTSAVERITRRFIDVITRNNISNTETITHEETDERRRRWGWCCLLPLLFFLLLPLLGGLWWLAPLAVRENATSAQSVIWNFYHDLSSYSFFPAKESSRPYIIPPPVINYTNATIQPPQIIYVKEPASCPVAKSCCDDVLLMKSQMALILERLANIQRDDASREQWQMNREAADKETRLAVDELRLMLIRVEKEISLRGQLVPQSVRERENFSLEDVRRLVIENIRRYDEDKTGEPDHALESSGATVISTRCSEDYKWGHTQLSLFGIPIPFTTWTTSPRLAIQPDMRPGQCWAFKGDQGYLVIKLTGDVHPTSFSLEHLPKNLSPTGKIDSAPKDFEVYGLVSEQGPGYILGKYVYEDNDYSLQNFQVQTALEPDDTFPFVELRITSNHGNPDYTCLYRFRVHGLLVKRSG